MAKDGLGKKILQGILIGGGTILSIISGGTLAGVGVPLIAAGLGVDTGSGDKVSVAANSIGAALGAGAAAAGATSKNLAVAKMLTWVQQNFMMILIGLAALFIVPKLLTGLFKSNRRRR